ncbi:MAG: COX15/CtaA family protein [Alphaproteobacteria bacterium]|nr:COX15/CtaA family protein [Alphaproteobacteria bacterium]
MLASRKAVGVWLLAIAVIILAMVTIGGLTRLTGSGLSITEWDPIMGAIPPLTDAQWADAFAKYQKIPQYILENRGMSLEAFKGIFWWEWTHRFLGRFLGVAFFVPFLLFAWKGAIRKSDWPRMLLLFVLGGLQGFIGWWMVQSGLETRVSVSQYRLAIHLGAALLLLIAILWIALEYLRDLKTPPKPAGRALGLVVLVYMQMLLGALVAGLHAGLIYNTWPDMNGRVFPEEPFFSKPWWINFFENPGLAQFDHRIGAYVVAGVAAFIFARGVRLKLVAAITAFQIGLGIFTLLLQAPEALAAFHQVTAAVLLCAAVWHAYELRHRSA